MFLWVHRNTFACFNSCFAYSSTMGFFEDSGGRAPTEILLEMRKENVTTKPSYKT
jgi:hypothetical protein